MATVIDALLVTIGIDGSKFQEGVSKVQAGLKNTSSASDKTAKDMEVMARRMAGAITRVRNEVLGLFAVFTAGRGIKEMFSDLTASNAALGYFSHNVDMATNEVAAWEGAARRAGGSAAGMDGSIQGLTQQFQTLALTGHSTIVPFFLSLGVHLSDAAGKMRPMRDILLDLADRFQGMDPARASAYGAAIGLDQGTINLLEQGRAAVQRLLDQQRRLGLPTSAVTVAAQQIHNAFADLEQRGSVFFQQIETDIAPALVELLNKIGSWIDEYGPAWESGIGGAIKSTVQWLEHLNWGGFWKEAPQIGQEVLGILKAIQNWQPPGWMRSLFNLPDAPAHGGGDTPGGASARPNTPAENAQIQHENAQTNRPYGYTGSFLHDTWQFLRHGLWHGASASSNPPDPATVQSYKPVLDLLGRAEGTDRGRGYNESLGYGRFTGGNVNLTGMTLDQIDALQSQMLTDPGNSMHSSALGRYQFTRTTLREMRERYGLTGSAVFDQAMQDRLAVMRIQMGGGLTQSALAGGWASIPDPNTGLSHYGGQGVGASSADVQRAIAAARAANNQLAAGAIQNGMTHYNDIQGAIRAARWASASSRVSSYAVGRADNSRRSETNINGPINIQTAATDAKGIARDMREALRRHALVAQANTGLA